MSVIICIEGSKWRIRIMSDGRLVLLHPDHQHQPVILHSNGGIEEIPVRVGEPNRILRSGPPS
ncbi:hypothetical protein SAMN05519103_00338 [Rhizobiales bacterium GAS113]|nr:hypothetical protein SAMN05519103_00338 [Rhizobiales bacterium GAS113]